MYSTRTRVHARILNGLSHEDHRAEVGEDVRVGPMEFQLNSSAFDNRVTLTV